MSRTSRDRGSSIEERYLDILDEYCDKAYVYSVICQKTSSYYNKLKYALQLPLIITSTVLTYINSNDDDSTASAMKVVNPVFNLTTALLLAVNNLLKLESKANDFKNNGIKFQKLSHLIEQKVLERNINQDLINSVITQYDNISENSMDNIPNHICAYVRTLYGTKRHLPIICNGVEKINSNILNAPAIIENVVSDISPTRSPRVLNTRPAQSDIQV